MVNKATLAKTKFSRLAAVEHFSFLLLPQSKVRFFKIGCCWIFFVSFVTTEQRKNFQDWLLLNIFLFFCYHRAKKEFSRLAAVEHFSFLLLQQSKERFDGRQRVIRKSMFPCMTLQHHPLCTDRQTTQTARKRRRHLNKQRYNTGLTVQYWVNGTILIYGTILG